MANDMPRPSREAHEKLTKDARIFEAEKNVVGALCRAAFPALKHKVESVREEYPDTPALQKHTLYEDWKLAHQYRRLLTSTQGVEMPSFDLDPFEPRKDGKFQEDMSDQEVVQMGDDILTMAKIVAAQDHKLPVLAKEDMPSHRRLLALIDQNEDIERKGKILPLFERKCAHDSVALAKEKTKMEREQHAIYERFNLREEGLRDNVAEELIVSGFAADPKQADDMVTHLQNVAFGVHNETGLKKAKEISDEQLDSFLTDFPHADPKREEKAGLDLLTQEQIANPYFRGIAREYLNVYTDLTIETSLKGEALTAKKEDWKRLTKQREVFIKGLRQKRGKAEAAMYALEKKPEKGEADPLVSRVLAGREMRRS